MFPWFSFTPESITALVEVILAVVIAIYLFSIKNKSFVLRLLAVSLVCESAHHGIKLVEFAVPALYQSVTSLLGVLSFIIYTLLVVFAYHYRQRLYPKEDRIVTTVLIAVGTAVSAFLFYIFFSAKPHTEIAGSEIALHGSLVFLLLTAAWAITVLLRKAQFFRRQSTLSDWHDNRKTMRACYAFAGIFSLKIFVILASVLSATGVISNDFRIYASLVLHILYLSSLTVAIIDHLKHTTSLRMKLVGLSLTSILLILSIGGLSIYSTESLLERTRRFISDRQILRFEREAGGAVELELLPYTQPVAAGPAVAFGDRENVEFPLDEPVFVFGRQYDRLFINRNGLVALGEPYVLAPAPVFYLEQRSAPYKSTLSRRAFPGPPFIAPLHLPTAVNEEAGFRVDRQDNGITITWEGLRPESVLAYEPSRQTMSFGTRIYEDGRIDIFYRAIDVYLFEGLVGLYPGANTEIHYFEPGPASEASLLPAGGQVYDLNRRFRSFVHAEMMRLVWLLVGSLLFVMLIFPIALRASILRPLEFLLDGVQRIDEGKLDEHVQVVVQDEIGNVASGFNKMMDSLREAHQKLVQHADRLEDEVTLRTEEIYQQKLVLEEQATRLRELDEMKSRFFANISHEFRTPLNLIMGPLQSILDGDFGSIEGKLRYRHEIMLEESGRLLKLINQLLDLSKLEAGRMELSLQTVDLVPLWRRIVHSFSSRAEMEQKTLHFHSDAPAMVGRVDVERIEQIGYNLIDNAFKFTAAGGKIHVSMAMESGNTASISIQDTGSGIPEEELPYIFDRFHQVDRHMEGKSPGTGIGLALVQELVYLHHGTIEVESTPGFGTTFYLYLPVDPEMEPEEAAVAPQLGGPADLAYGRSGRTGATMDEENDLTSLRDWRILVVDDDDEFRLFIGEYLGRNFEIASSENGRKGLESAIEDPPDLIVSDLMMPEMDGVSFLEAVRDHPDLDHIPFILLTAKASIESRIEGLEYGADDYLSKPVDPRELRTRVQNLLDQRRRLIEKYTDMIRLGPKEIMVESADAELIGRIVEVAEERIADAGFSVTLLAEEVGMGVRDLQRKLKKLMDIGPKELITNMRVEKAKQLLAGRAGTVSQISYKVGFSRPEYFMRIFKQLTGMTPGQYMKKEGQG